MVDAGGIHCRQDLLDAVLVEGVPGAPGVADLLAGGGVPEVDLAPDAHGDHPTIR